MRRPPQRRFGALDTSLWEARERLRRRLSLLGVGPQQLPDTPEPTIVEARAWAGEEWLLAVLQRARLSDDPGLVSNGQRLLSEYEQAHPEFTSTWDELVAAKWIRIVWDRWHTPYGIHAKAASDQTADERAIYSALVFLQSAPQGRSLSIDPAMVVSLLDAHRTSHPGTPSFEQLARVPLFEPDGQILRVKFAAPLLRAFEKWLPRTRRETRRRASLSVPR